MRQPILFGSRIAPHHELIRMRLTLWTGTIGLLEILQKIGSHMLTIAGGVRYGTVGISKSVGRNTRWYHRIMPCTLARGREALGGKVDASYRAMS